MNTIKGGGPAFYPSLQTVETTGDGRQLISNPGCISIRDYFAAAAMQALTTLDSENIRSWKDIAEDAYVGADAMLAVRAKGGA